MAKTATKSQVVDIWKRKRWHKILAPKLFNEQVLGETIALEPNMLVGRTISVNLMNLTRDMKKQNMNLVFQIDRVMGDTAFTKVKYFEVSPSSIRRFVRKGKTRMDDSFACKTADNDTVRIKTLFIASGKLKGSIATALRKKSREFLSNLIRNSKNDTIIQDVVGYKMQRELRDAIRKEYPVKTCEIKMLILGKEDIKEGKAAAEAVGEIKAEEVQPAEGEKEEAQKTEEAEEPKKEKTAKKKKDKEESSETEEDKDIEDAKEE
jgi:small subunit ribosomal protein S3Ae